MEADTADMDSLYGGSPEAEAGPKPEGSVDQEEAAETDTALVPVKVLTGKGGAPLKEGDEVVLKVVKLYGDEAEVEYSTTKPGAIGAGSQTADEELDSLGGAGAETYET